MGITFTHMGEHALTLEHFDQALLLYDPDQHRDDAFLYAPNPGVAMRCFAAWTLWFIGQPDQAVARIQEALHLARELSEPHGLAHALLFAAILHQLRREAPIARELAEAGISASADHGLVMYQAMGTTIRAWTLTDSGDEERGIEEMREALAALRTMGTKLLRPHFLSLLAGALERASRVDEGLRLLDEAFALADSTGEHYYLAELHRMKGEQLLAQAGHRALSPAVGTRAETVASAEACFHQSIVIARRQGARSLELRAVVSLARLYESEGQHMQAVTLLAPAYASFTEGFDTADLRDAKALLEQFS
jgi:predicted ATPase